MFLSTSEHNGIMVILGILVIWLGHFTLKSKGTRNIGILGNISNVHLFISKSDGHGTMVIMVIMDILISKANTLGIYVM